jgi:uncharacterized membrane protein (UPF0127 family)
MAVAGEPDNHTEGYMGPDRDVRTVPITLGGKKMQAVIADTERARVKGLLEWERIGEETGMLLDFGTDGQNAIHMQGMKFPIDALWIDGTGVIKLIYPEIMPDTGRLYPSMFPCRYCLEIKSGFCRKYGIKMGQNVRFGVPTGRGR